MVDRALVKALRDKGLSYQAIGEVLNVSRQRVHQLLNPGISSRVSLGKNIIYPNLLEWSVEHKCNREEFLRRMGYTVNANSKAVLLRVLTGKQNPKKDYIDKMLNVTGLLYEILFEVIPNAD